MSEQWRDVPCWEGFYQVSDLGRVKSLARAIPMSNGRNYNVHEKILRPYLSDAGLHRSVHLMRCNAVKVMRVHRLVLLAFSGEPPEGMEGCHRDGNGHNNALSNLYWGTRSENIRDEVRHGTHNNARKTECRNGHPFTPENTYLGTAGGRCCRICRRLSEAKYRAKKLLAVSDA